jgi:uncharacterized protein YraI
MKLHGIALSAFTMIALPQIAEAAWGQAIDDLNVRACAGPQCPPIGILPAGARVWVDRSLSGWSQITFNGMTGYVSARYIGFGYAAAPPYAPDPVYVPGPALVYVPQVVVAGPYPQHVIPAQPFYGYAWPGYQYYGPWYEGRRRYFGHLWTTTRADRQPKQ